MPSKKEIAVFTFRMIVGTAKGTGKVTSKVVKFTVEKAKKKDIERLLNALERARKAVVINLDSLQAENQPEQHRKNQLANVKQAEKVVFRTIGALNHYGFKIKYHGNGLVEFGTTDTTESD